jgi:type IV pilus biogenesis protein CpaD/CtpE
MKENTMKRLVAVAVVMLLAACAPRDEATTADTPADVPAMAPAPADTMVVDTMPHDTLHMEHMETPAQP